MRTVLRLDVLMSLLTVLAALIPTLIKTLSPGGDGFYGGTCENGRLFRRKVYF